MSKLEQKCINFIQRNIILIGSIILFAISLKIRISGMQFRSDDYNNCLEPWFNQIKNGGGLITLKDTIGDYNVPYMFILTILTYLPVSPLISIKIVSIVFDYLATSIMSLIVFSLLEDNNISKTISIITFDIAIFLPTVILNSSFWAQCDMIYVTFLLCCILFLIQDSYIVSFIFFSLALSFKLQAIFIFPVLVILCFANKKYSILHFFLIPITFSFMLLPALIANRPLNDTLKIYFEQTQSQKSMTKNYPNLYILLRGSYDDFHKLAIWLTIAILGFMTIYILYKKWSICDLNILLLCMWCAFTCVMFLPSMHDRYGILLDVLSFVYCIIERKKIYMALGINFVSLISYTSFLIGDCVIQYQYLAIGNLLLFILITKDFLYQLKLDNQIYKQSSNEIEDINIVLDNIEIQK